MEASFHLSYTVFCKKILVPPKVRVLPCVANFATQILSDAGLQRKIDAAPGIHLKRVNCAKTLDLENFATLVSGLVHKAHRWSSLWITPFTHPHIHYTLVDCIPSNSVTSLCSGFVVRLVPAVVQ